MNPRNTYPEHFERGVDFALALAACGHSHHVLMTMARGFANRGLVDAADGVVHAVLALKAKDLS